MPDPVNVEPVVGQHLASRDLLAHAIDQDLAAAPGKLPRPASLSRLQHVRSGSLELS